MAKVVHCKKEPFDVYIGRPSKWGNPFTLKNPKDENERLVVILFYRMWLDEHPEIVEMAKKELRGKTLGCWCAPRLCHGDILLEIANEETY